MADIIAPGIDLTPLLPLLISAAGVAGGAWYAFKRGLPAARAEVEAATKDLISTLKDQLKLANDSLAEIRPQLVNASERIEALEEEVDRLTRRAAALYGKIDDLEGIIERRGLRTPQKTTTARTARTTKGTPA